MTVEVNVIHTDAASATVDRPGGQALLTESVAGLAPWQEALMLYVGADLRRSVLNVMTSVVPYLGLSVVMYLLVNRSYPLTLLVAVPAAGFLVRTYIVFHDCAHGSFLRSKRANRWLGTVLGLLVFQSFASWRHSHAVHHATAGDLDRRGVGDVPTITVAEYRAQSPRARLQYRLFRNPVVMFGLGPVIALIIQPRIVPHGARPRIRRSVLATDAVLAAMVAAMCVLVGVRDLLLVQGPVVMLGGAAGIWLFYVQHQFEDVYWESSGHWSYLDTALHGSSYLKLPKVLQFFSGNIGLHHVHHLNARIPNYNLQRANDEVALFRGVPTMSLLDGLRAVKLKLYDEDRHCMVTFAQARVSEQRPAGAL
ncbi:MAG: fatty acid desaturase [Solirubrobacteraceae bacterium]